MESGADLVELYGVPPKRFNQAVTCNSERFPADFKYLKSQIATLNWGGRRYFGSYRARALHDAAPSPDTRTRSFRSGLASRRAD